MAEPPVAIIVDTIRFSAMAYKSSIQARSEYLSNEEKNRDTNRRSYERKKESDERERRARVLVALIIMVVLYFFFKDRR